MRSEAGVTEVGGRPNPPDGTGLPSPAGRGAGGEGRVSLHPSSFILSTSFIIKLSPSPFHFGQLLMSIHPYALDNRRTPQIGHPIILDRDRSGLLQCFVCLWERTEVRVSNSHLTKTVPNFGHCIIYHICVTRGHKRPIYRLLRS